MTGTTTRFATTYLHSRAAGRLAVVSLDNGADWRHPNTFGEAALRSLSLALDELDTAVADSGDPLRGVLVTGKPFGFAAGADLERFPGASAGFARRAARAGHEAFGRLRDLPVPTLAAVNGVCLGGGLELALHCDYRTLSEAAGALGFPEVFLSIVPAWGGTQLAPRLVGARVALDVVVGNALDNNRLLEPAQAFHLGFADRLLPAADFLEQSLALLERLVTGQERVERPAPDDRDDGDLDALLAGARAATDARVHGATPAPYAAIDLVGFAARGGDLAEGLAREEEALAQLLPARQAQAAVYAFGLTQQRVRRQPGRPQAPARRVAKVGVVGAGLMGAQLGALFLQRLQMPLAFVDVDEQVLTAARAHVEEQLDRRVARKRLAPGKAAFLKSVVTYGLDHTVLAGADVVVEAVPEVRALKQKVFAQAEEVVDPGCLLATNTSSLSVAAMAADLAHPERVVGLHFFNPVAVLPLVELVRTPVSSDEAVATAFALAKALGKSAVACADRPAFVVNRLLARFIGACLAAVNRGAEFAEVDDAVKALGLPMGPFELLGLVGPGVAAHVARTLHEAYPDRFPLDPNLQRLAESGLPGVYDWGRGRVVSDGVRERWRVEPGPAAPNADEVRAGALEAVADEIRHLLDEGVVADARDVDTCMLLGAGWPFFMGGICAYLDQVGVSQRLFGAPLVGPDDPAPPG